MTFSPLFGAGPLCREAGFKEALSFLPTSSGRLGVLSSSWVEIWSLTPGFCSVCYPHILNSQGKTLL